jgi:hypothetical protein
MCALFFGQTKFVDLVEKNRPLTELRATGPFIMKRFLRWIDNPPTEKPRAPAIRRDFIALANARVLLAKNPKWAKQRRGDLPMHGRYSDGSGTIPAVYGLSLQFSF